MSQIQVDIDPEQTIVALWTACAGWEQLADRIERLAEEGFTEGSRGQTDTAAAAVVDPPPVVSQYVIERARNITRMLRALHRGVFATVPGKLHLDATVMYPLMRAALEDAATIAWLRTPEEVDVRLTRALQALNQEQKYFVENHELLASTAAGLGGQAAELSEPLASHTAEEKAAAAAYFAQLAELLGLDPAEVTGTLSTRRPIVSVYGGRSVEIVTWKMLSDLSHFSFMTMRHLAESRVPGTAVPLLHATMRQFVGTVNRVCLDAVVAIERTAEVTSGA
jgi:hypothetical protein